MDSITSSISQAITMMQFWDTQTDLRKGHEELPRYTTKTINF